MSTNPRRRTVATAGSEPSLRFTSVNGILLVAALAALALGYLLLHNGSHVAAPLLLTLGYVVLIPLAIIL